MVSYYGCGAGIILESWVPGPFIAVRSNMGGLQARQLPFYNIHGDHDCHLGNKLDVIKYGVDG